MTAAERLAALSGAGSTTAAAHLLAIGSGATAGALLVSRSSLAIATAAEHLLDDTGTRSMFVLTSRRRSSR